MELDNESKCLELTMESFPQTTYEAIVDPSFNSTIPDSKAIDEIIATVNDLLAIAEKRGVACDRGMRELASQRKNKLEDERLDLEAIDRKEAEDMRRHASGASSKFKKKSGGKREEKERPLTHGAHGLAPQDGSNLGKHYFRYQSLYSSIAEFWKREVVIIAVGLRSYGRSEKLPCRQECF